jgi:hypothetical protein
MEWFGGVYKNDIFHSTKSLNDIVFENINLSKLKSAPIKIVGGLCAFEE